MIEVQGLSKRYGQVLAVNDVSFSLGQEQVLGFLGPNGAGKTTVMKILTGFHYPTAGTALIDGVSVMEEPTAIKSRIGYLPESVPLYGDLTVKEYLSFIADARLVSKAEKREAIAAAIAECGLESMAVRRIEALSKGYKQRVGLAQAIIHDPPILILDEPTTGLDPNQIIEIRSLIKELGRSKTVILSTHILQEVEAVCSQVLIISGGRIAAQGSAEHIASSMKGADSWELLLLGSPPAGVESKLRQLGEGLKINELESVDNAVKLNFTVTDAGITGEAVFDWALSSGLKIVGMQRKKLSLEDIFVKLTVEGGKPVKKEALHD